MEQRKNKFAYDKEYYESRYYVVDGNAARQLYAYENVAVEEEEYVGLQPEKQQDNTPVREPKVRVKRHIKLNLMPVTMLLVAMSALVFLAFKYLDVKSDISQMDKKITVAKNNLADVNALNASLESELDVTVDRDYVYSVAVGRLGMVYPNDNQIVYYKTSAEGYVRQYSIIE